MKDIIGFSFYIFSIVYTFVIWGFWWGLLSIIFPIFFIIDLAKYIFENIPWI